MIDYILLYIAIGIALMFATYLKGMYNTYIGKPTPVTKWWYWWLGALIWPYILYKALGGK